MSYTDDELIDALKQHNGNKVRTARALEIDERSMRRRLKRIGYTGELRPVRKSEQDHHTYVITSAVNATKIHPKYLKSLERYCAERDARLMVIPMRYKNPTRQGEGDDDEWWDARIAPYLVHDRVKIAPHTVVLADIKIQPTAINPLQSWLTVSGTNDAIIGHTKIALKTVATKPGQRSKIVQTTGAVTVEQYSDTNAGKKGEFHHTLGAVIVEVEGKHVWTRHICPLKDGSFIDLGTKYTPDGSEPAPRAEVLTMGDIHAELEDKSVTRATRLLADTVRPISIVGHDILNFGSAGHHNDYFERYRRHVTGTASVLRELQTTAVLMDKLAAMCDQFVVVGSNHHDHFKQWLLRHENALDLENAVVFHETKGAMLKAILNKSWCDPFKYWMDQLMKSPQRVKWLKPGESFSRHAVEFGWHGHKGPNGARGSTKGFANIGAKVTKGHSHGAEIIDGAHSVGVSGKLNMGYNVDSPSAWSQSHEVLYANGKRTLLHMAGGRFFR